MNCKLGFVVHLLGTAKTLGAIGDERQEAGTQGKGDEAEEVSRSVLSLGN